MTSFQQGFRRGIVLGNLTGAPLFTAACIHQRCMPGVLIGCLAFSFALSACITLRRYL